MWRGRCVSFRLFRQLLFRQNGYAGLLLLLAPRQTHGGWERVTAMGRAERRIA